MSSDDEEVNVFHQTLNTNNCQEKTQSHTDSARKEKKGLTRKRIADKFIQRNSGQSYTTLGGKVKKAREMRRLEFCRAKCQERISEEKRQQIFNEYWALGSRDKRAAFVSALVSSAEKKSVRKRTTDSGKEKNRQITNSFNLKVDGTRTMVCRKCFMSTLGETHMFVTQVINNARASTSGIITDDKRGKSEPANKTKPESLLNVKNHILSFPSYKSHYTRRTNDKRYLPSFLNLTIMFSLYKETTENPVSRFVYEREFHSLGIKFKQPKVDTCHKCDIMAAKLKAANNNDKEEIQQEIDTHHKMADQAYLMKNEDKILSQTNSNIACYAFDLQQCLPTPYVNSSKSFYKRQLWTYNLTMHRMDSSYVNCFMWHEAEGARGANQIAICLYKELSQLPSTIDSPILYSDSCGGQNRNSHVAAMFLCLMQNHTSFKTIDHKFMVSGHSHLECDVDHSLIEKQKKKLQMPIEVPRDWYQLVRAVGKKTNSM